MTVRWPCALVIGLLMAGCAAKKSTDEGGKPQATLFGVKLWFYERDVLATVGRAARLTYQRATSDFQAAEVLLRFPSQTAKPEPGSYAGVELRCSTMDGNRYTRQAIGREEVIMRTAAGLVGYTTYAHFDGQKMSVQGDQPIQMRGAHYTTSAKSFSFQLKNQIYDFFPQVKTHLEGSSP